MKLEEKTRRVLIGIAITITIIVIGAAIVEQVVLRGVVARQVSEHIGRRFAIEGNLNIDFFPLTVHMGRVVVGNTDWGSRANMLEADELILHVRFWPLLTGRLVLPEVILVRPDVLLEVSRRDEPNWVFSGKQSGSQTAGGGPVIGRLTIEHGVLRYRDSTPTTHLQIAMNTLAAEGAAEPLIAIEGDGQFKGDRFSLAGRVGSLLGLRDSTRPYPIDLKARIGDTQAQARGELINPLHLSRMNVDLQVSGPDMGKMHSILGLSIPSTPPYRLKGRLRHEHKTWRFADFHGTVGNSDLAGEFSVDLSSAKPFLRGDLISRLLDINDLAGFIGAPPKTGPGEVASAEQKREAARKQQKSTLLPDRPFNLEKLNSMNADVRLRGERIKTSLPLDHLNAHLRLENGLLTLKPLNFGIASGNVVSTLILDVHQSPIRTQGTVTVRNLALRRLIPATRVTQPAEGVLGGQAKIATVGDTFAQMAGNADGEMGLVTSGGKISNLLIVFTEIDIAQVLKMLLGGDQDVSLNCAVADFKLKDGRMQTETLVADTAEAKIVADGTIDLDHEQLDLKLRSLPKKPKLLVVPSQVDLTGSFKQPKVALEKKSLITRGAAMLALGATAGPAAALIPLVSTGPGTDTPCRALIEKTKEDMKTAPKKKSG